MAQSVLLALDIGTTSIKAALYQHTGEEIRTVSFPTRNVKAGSGEGLHEIDAERIWGTIRFLLKSLENEPDFRRVSSIGVTALLGTVYLDRDGQPVGPCSTYADNRASSEMTTMVQRIGVEEVYRASGKRINAEAAASKLLRMKRVEPERYAKVATIISLKDYILFKLSGQIVTDPIHASYTLLSQIQTGEWNLSMMKELGLDVSRFPSIRPCTEVVGYINQETALLTGLPEGIPVSNGAPDGSAGCFGAGLNRAGIAVNVMGTTDVFFTQCEQIVYDPERRVIINPHILENNWFVGGPMSITGGALEQLREWTKETDYEIYKLVSDIPPGSDGLIFLSAMGGERTPYWNPRMKGVISGIGIHHDKRHLFRAVLEGTSYPLKDIVDIWKRLNLDISCIIAAGGGSRISEWLQIRADITGKPVIACRGSEFSSLGAAYIAAIAVGLQTAQSLPDQHRIRTCQPVPERTEAYRQFHQRYAEMRAWFETYYDKV